YIMGVLLIVALSKLIGSVFLVIHDIIKSVSWLIKKSFKSKAASNKNINNISRIEFLKKTALVASIIPFSTLMFGVLKSAFDYTIHKQKIKIPNLPSAFKGLKIVQISDIHTGSFISTEPLEKAIKLLKEQKPDIIFFTGDLVNDITEEALPFIETLKSITAPLGVFSILGNHDYGDYFYKKEDLEGKKHNYQLMQAVHKKLGWKLLLNENHIIQKDNERLAILGVENWGSELRFPKYGDINKAKDGCLDTDVKLLLSHDPSHWDAHVLPNHPDIAATFSGHTHGMQFGIEIPGFKWIGGSTNVEDFGLDVTLPIQINDSNAFLTGFNIDQIKTKFHPTDNFRTVSSVNLKIGFNKKHSSKWSGTYMFLPKLSSDFKNLGSKDFQFGALALMKY
ncbi:MAG: metallophosphoesterase, partial [Vicingaceae bacterium]